MRIYLDEYDISAIEKLNDSLTLSGFTTNPKILSKVTDPWDFVDKLFGLATQEQKVFVQSYESDAENIVEEAIKFSNTFAMEKLVIKIPLSLEGLKAIKYLKNQHPEIQILGTTVYSYTSAIAAFELGVEYIAPYVNRMDKQGIDPFREVDLMMKYKKKMDSNTEVIGASFKDVEQIGKCAEVGIDSITIPAALLEETLNIEVVERDIENFRNDWANQHDTNYMDVKK